MLIIEKPFYDGNLDWKKEWTDECLPETKEKRTISKMLININIYDIKRPIQWYSGLCKESIFTLPYRYGQEL